MLKRLKERHKELWFRIRRFFYKRKRLSTTLLYTRAILVRVLVALVIAAWATIIGYGILELTSMVVTFTIPKSFILRFLAGTIFMMGLIGSVVLIIAGIELLRDSYKDTKRKIRRKFSYFCYDMEYEMEDRAAAQRDADRNIERAKLAEPKWEV